MWWSGAAIWQLGHWPRENEALLNLFSWNLAWLYELQLTPHPVFWFMNCKTGPEHPGFEGCRDGAPIGAGFKTSILVTSSIVQPDVREQAKQWEHRECCRTKNHEVLHCLRVSARPKRTIEQQNLILCYCLESTSRVFNLDPQFQTVWQKIEDQNSPHKMASTERMDGSMCQHVR